MEKEEILKEKLITQIDWLKLEIMKNNGDDYYVKYSKKELHQLIDVAFEKQRG